MTLIALLIGVVLVVAAFRGTASTLFNALGTDVPAYVIWAAAIVAVGVIGYIPGLKPVSRGLLALVLVVIILNNYQSILNNFQSVASASTTPNSPATVQAGGTSAPLGLSTIAPLTTGGAEDFLGEMGFSSLGNVTSLFGTGG
jgi:hypothetical protein